MKIPLFENFKPYHRDKIGVPSVFIEADDTSFKYGFTEYRVKFGQKNFSIQAYDGYSMVGLITFVGFGDELKVQEIEVDEDYRRQGIATDLYDFIPKFLHGYRITSEDSMRSSDLEELYSMNDYEDLGNGWHLIQESIKSLP
jgi:GNAT superfamily N-acetyltransferase